ncbi:hypothetical protein EI555_020709 [Monodon monoceros]|uniref:Uncharacterized protein n=1 Tax=Monodon monoceros TaxID=40151 RepID=A0A4U1F3D9_MONMO|nr:hypothetical protein EI555_020709 [Monodon monoceros]
MTNTKRKRRSTHCIFSRPFRKQEVVPLATYTEQHECHHGKTEGVYEVALCAAGIIVNKQVKDKILAKRRSICVECIKCSKSWDRREPRRKRGRLCETDGEEPEMLGAIPYELMT